MCDLLGIALISVIIQIVLIIESTDPRYNMCIDVNNEWIH